MKYLVVPLSSDYIHASHRTSLLNKMFMKFKSWDSELLFMAGRAELIQSTITPIVLCRLLINHLPSSVLQKIERMCAIFFRVVGIIKLLGSYCVGLKQKGVLV